MMLSQAWLKGKGLAQWLRWLLEYPQPTSEYVGSSPCSTPDSGTLLTSTRKAAGDDPSSWVPATQMGDSDGVSEPELWPDPALAIAGIRTEPVEKIDLSLPPYIFWFSLPVK